MHSPAPKDRFSMLRLSRTTLPLVAIAILAACASGGGGTSASTSTVMATAAGASANPSFREQTTGWRMLVENGSLAQWRGYKSDTMPPGWKAEGDMLFKERPVADIMTRDQFGDFELMLEWRITQGGNAGIFYRGTEEYNRIYWSAPEYQLLDDANAPDGKNVLTQAATIYGLYPRVAGTLKPVGEWNETRILLRGAHVEHWLNGVKTAESEMWGPEWTAKVKASKFNVYPNYGMAKRGHIALQGDHAGSLHFRNIKIREIR
jgi:hypothetical protein